MTTKLDLDIWYAEQAKTDNHKRYKLRVDLEDTTGNTAFVEYGKSSDESWDAPR